MVYEFDGFSLDTARVELVADGAPVPLERKTYDLLVFLVANRDRVVTKTEAFEQVWPGVFVTDASISTAIKQLRRALGDDGVSQRIIRTVRGKGFRFVAEVAERAPRETSRAVEPKAQASATPTGDEASSPAPEIGAGAPVLAVLPFLLIRADDAYAAISDGLPIELISALSRLRGVRTIARGSSFRFDPAALDLGEVRARLGAEYALCGTIEAWGGRLSVTVELVDARSAQVVWAESFASPIDEIFDVRRRIAQAVCGAVEMQLPAHEADALRRVPCDRLDAWGCYHLGIRRLFRFSGPDREAARAHLERAVALDPGFARAHGGLAFVELEEYKFLDSGAPQESRKRGLDLAAKAADLDPLDPFCNLVMARASWLSGDLEAGMGWADRAVRISPNYAPGLYELGKFNAFGCHADEADGFAASAMSLSPLDPHLPGMASTRGLAAFLRDDEAEAVRHADMALKTPNPHFFVRLVAAAIFSLYGEEERARRLADSIAPTYRALDKDHVWKLFGLKDRGRHATMVDGLRRAGLS